MVGLFNSSLLKLRQISQKKGENLRFCGVRVVLAKFTRGTGILKPEKAQQSSESLGPGGCKNTFISAWVFVSPAFEKASPGSHPGQVPEKISPAKKGAAVPLPG